jgi:hypothetical protein
VTKDFMNSFFNTLNEHTTENFVIFKELKNSYNTSILRRTKMLFQLIVDMFRMLEVMTAWVPEIFVDKNQVHSLRLINYIMFVLNSVFVGKIDSYIEYFAGRAMNRGHTLAHFLAPIIGILKNLYEAASNLGQKDNARFDNLAEIFRRSDSFDPVLFHKLKAVVLNELPPSNR